jgi:hypothetical protein
MIMNASLEILPPFEPSVNPMAASSRQGLRGLFEVVAWGLLSLIMVAPTVVLVDYYYYRRLTVPAINILVYNVWGGTWT